jgi:beta-xylosidase
MPLKFLRGLFSIFRPRGDRRSLAVAILAPGLAIVVSACAVRSTSTGPVANRDFPDPSIVRVASLYYAFGTQAGGGHPAVQRLTSADHVKWSVPVQPEALASVPRWADYAGTWAPSATYVNGRYVMYYSVHQIAGNECISIATASSPTDQFVDTSSRPLICPSGGLSIDPSPFVGPNGQRYLLWKGPSAGGVATLFAQKMNADGLSMAPGTPAQLLRAKANDWTAWNIEGPDMLLSGGKYFLFYSANNYWTTNYGIGYAVCSSPLGPCTNVSTKGPWVGTSGNRKGPGGQSFFYDTDGNLFMAYHVWADKVGYGNGGIRSLWIDQVHFVNGGPTLG